MLPVSSYLHPTQWFVNKNQQHKPRQMSVRAHLVPPSAVPPFESVLVCRLPGGYLVDQRCGCPKAEMAVEPMLCSDCTDDSQALGVSCTIGRRRCHFDGSRPKAPIFLKKTDRKGSNARCGATILCGKSQAHTSATFTSKVIKAKRSS